MAALGIAFSIVGAALARHIGIHYNLSHFQQTVLVLVANFLSFAIFWVVKLLVFNRMFKVELEEFDEHLTEEESKEGTTVSDTPAVCGSVPEIVELQRNAEVLALAGCDHLLQVVPLLARHAQLVALGLRGHALEPRDP